ncbi:hypothetical protein RJ639_021883 [Escallonia herrerae]|uniref:RING-type domain-containing protein n=1 Tax=Escallonia herrerae TaxID=1293975 RepID=A0AA89AGU1_9ASTE|nr:hypothetical protein RJ639_021883 [Escallonia herrerae]
MEKEMRERGGGRPPLVLQQARSTKEGGEGRGVSAGLRVDGGGGGSAGEGGRPAGGGSASLVGREKGKRKEVDGSKAKADDVRVNGKELGTRRYEAKLGFQGAVECAVYLSKIEEGDEIRDLRCEHLFHHAKADDVRVNGKELETRRYEAKLGFEGAVECAVCLSKIEEGGEIRDLRCEHIFNRVCLDRWIGFKQLTCPLCRSSLAPSKTPALEPEKEVIIFRNFCSFSSSDRTTWGLR